MIEFLHTLNWQGQPQVKQSLVSPSVYLDTWAIRLFAEEVAQGERFRAALIQAGGTLALSDLNLLEFTSFADPRHIRAAAALVDSLLPHCFFTRADPFVVMTRELEYLLKGIHSSPAGDENMLRLFAEGTTARGGRMTTTGWFESVYENRVTLSAGAQDVADSLYNGINLIRERIEREPGFRQVVERGVGEARRQKATQALLRAVVDRLQADHRFPQDKNSAVDLLHSIVPSAYCDFVLVDGHWYDLLTAVRLRLVKVGIAAQVAAPFTRRDNGVERFLRELEEWRPLPA